MSVKIRFIEMPDMVETREILVERTTRERWFPGLYEPWEPWVKSKKEARIEPSPNLLSYHNESTNIMIVVGHPHTIMLLKENFRREYAAAIS